MKNILKLAGIMAIIVLVTTACTPKKSGTQPQTQTEDETTLSAVSTTTTADFQMEGTTLVRYTGNEEHIIIPPSVTAIGEAAFIVLPGGTSPISVTIPSSVTIIGNNAFQNCAYMTSVTFSSPSSLTTIGRDAFLGCSSLTGIDIPSSVTTIGESAFGDCQSLTSVTIPSSVTVIGDFAFDSCYSLKSVTLFRSTSVGNRAFESSVQILYDGEPTSSADFQMDGTTLVQYTGNEAHVIIPSSVTIIFHHAFLQCYSLTSVTIPSSVIWIGGEAFGACGNLTSVTFESPSSLNSIGEAAFASSGLTNIIIPSSVTEIHDYAFNNTKLSSITLSRSTKVADNAFPEGVQINYRD